MKPTLKLSPGEQFLASVITRTDVEEFIRLGTVEQFLKPTELVTYEKVKAHVRRHGVLPAEQTVRTMGLRIEDQPEPPSFYYDRLRERHVKIQLARAWEHVNKEMRSDPLGALSHFQNACFDLSLTASPHRLLTLQDAEDVVWPRYVQRMTAGDEYGIRLGWSTFDAMTGGVVGGDLTSFVGRPAQGKTQMLLWGALNVNRVQKLPVMVVSMEMTTELILERCVATYTKVPLSEIRRQRGRSIPKTRLRRFKKELTELRDHETPFHIIDGNLGKTVPDIYMLARQLQPAAIFIDGGYLIRHENERLQLNQRIAANCNLIKQMLATDLNVATFVTWQVNREGAKSKRKEEAVTLDHIAGSDAISQDSSLICMLDEEESPETIIKRMVRILKGRSGEQGQFEIAWDWEGMNFGDYVQPKVTDLHIDERKESQDGTEADAEG